VSQQEDLRAEAHKLAVEAWDTFEVRWVSDPVQPRLVAAVDAAAEVYEERLRQRGNFGRRVTFAGGPLDGQVREVTQVEGHLVVSDDGHGAVFSRPQVYRLNFQALRYEHLGHVCPGNGSS
jgi:hypothetical protein